MLDLWTKIKAWLSGLLINFWATKKVYIIVIAVVIVGLILLGLFVPAARPYITWLGTAGLWILSALKEIASILFYILSLPSKLFGG